MTNRIRYKIIIECETNIHWEIHKMLVHNELTKILKNVYRSLECVSVTPIEENKTANK